MYLSLFSQLGFFVLVSRGQSQSCSSWVRLTQMQRIYLSLIIFLGFLGLFSLCRSLWCLYRNVYKWLKSEHGIIQHNISSDTVQMLSLKLRFFMVLAPFTSAILAIGPVEGTIRVGKMDLSAVPLTSTGQLIHFLTGVLNLCVVLWCGFRDGWQDWPIVLLARDLMHEFGRIIRTVRGFLRFGNRNS